MFKGYLFLITTFYCEHFNSRLVVHKFKEVFYHLENKIKVFTGLRILEVSRFD
jgi:hypothetical protein